jgi:hypothetical protein
VNKSFGSRLELETYVLLHISSLIGSRIRVFIPTGCQLLYPYIPRIKAPVGLTHMLPSTLISGHRGITKSLFGLSRSNLAMS